MTSFDPSHFSDIRNGFLEMKSVESFTQDLAIKRQVIGQAQLYFQDRMPDFQDRMPGRVKSTSLKDDYIHRLKALHNGCKRIYDAHIDVKIYDRICFDIMALSGHLEAESRKQDEVLRKIATDLGMYQGNTQLKIVCDEIAKLVKTFNIALPSVNFNSVTHPTSSPSSAVGHRDAAVGPLDFSGIPGWTPISPTPKRVKRPEEKTKKESKTQTSISLNDPWAQLKKAIRAKDNDIVQALIASQPTSELQEEARSILAKEPLFAETKLETFDIDVKTKQIIGKLEKLFDEIYKLKPVNIKILNELITKAENLAKTIEKPSIKNEVFIFIVNTVIKVAFSKDKPELNKTIIENSEYPQNTQIHLLFLHGLYFDHGLIEEAEKLEKEMNDTIRKIAQEPLTLAPLGQKIDEALNLLPSLEELSPSNCIVISGALDQWIEFRIDSYSLIKAPAPYLNCLDENQDKELVEKIKKCFVALDNILKLIEMRGNNQEKISFLKHKIAKKVSCIISEG